MNHACKAVARHTPWLTVLYTIVIVWAYNQPNSWERFGLWSEHPTLWAGFTQTLAHADFTHIAGNLVLLVPCGWAVEKYLGRVHLVAIVLASSVGVMAYEVHFDWLDAVRVTGGVSSVAMALCAAMLFVGAKVMLKTYHGTVREVEPLVGFLALLIGPIALVANILGDVQNLESGNETQVAWGGHNLGWAFGLITVSVLYLPFMYRDIVQAIAESIEDRRRNRVIKARVRQHYATLREEQRAEQRRVSLPQY